MSEVPDKVIEEASVAGAEAAELARGGVVERGRPRDRAFAGVIAAWARNQERDRIKALLEEREAGARLVYEESRLGRLDPKLPQASARYWEGRMDALGNLLTELGDRDGADNREDGRA